MKDKYTTKAGESGMILPNKRQGGAYERGVYNKTWRVWDETSQQKLGESMKDKYTTKAGESGMILLQQKAGRRLQKRSTQSKLRRDLSGELCHKIWERA